VDQALIWARDGDLLLFSLQAQRDRAIDRLTALQVAGWRAGQPLA